VSPVIEFKDVSVSRDGKTILGPLSMAIQPTERWVIVGPNGAGKTTTLNLMATHIHPSSGEVFILDERLGSVDVFELRTRIGFTTNNLLTSIPDDEKILDLVMSSAYAIIGRWSESYDLWDESRAIALLTTLGIRELRERTFSTLSEGEKKRAIIARSMMANPELLLLDEPAAGLDLAGREDLLKRLDLLADDPTAPATVIVTHHLEEIPHGTTHALLLRHGLPVSMGLIDSVITESNLALAYGVEISLHKSDGRYFARAK
jgi:iron complex transport system ATP-binding protein